MSEQQIKKFIEDCMIQYIRNFDNKQDMHSRLDELFLLWSHLKDQSFIETTHEFGLNYQEFSDREYLKVYYTIYKKFKYLLQEVEQPKEYIKAKDAIKTFRKSTL